MNHDDLILKNTPEKGILVLSINRPDSLNALNISILSQLFSTIEKIELDLQKNEGPRVLVITGAGSKSFVAGADVSEMAEFSSEAAIRFSSLGHKVFNKIESLSIPVIAAVNGYALGGGCELALACDYIIADEQALFGLPEVGLGLIPGFGGTIRLREKVGLSHAKELIFSAKKINATEALRIGLVNQIAPSTKFESVWMDEAKRIAINSTAANRIVKKLLNETLDYEMHARGDAEVLMFGSLFGTKDQKEGINAFIEKRKPEFK